MAQLWGGRFTGNISELAWNFNASISFDQRFLEKDVEGSIKGVEKDLKNIGKQKPKETGKDSDAAADEPVPTEDSFGDASVKVPENDSPVSGKEPDTAPVSTQPQPQESGSQPADPAASADSINNA